MKNNKIMYDNFLREYSSNITIIFIKINNIFVNGTSINVNSDRLTTVLIFFGPIKLKILNCRQKDGDLSPQLEFEFQINTTLEATDNSIKILLRDSVYQSVLNTENPEDFFVDKDTKVKLEKDGYNCIYIEPSK